MAGRIVPMKNSNDTTGNRTRDLPTCSAVPQPRKGYIFFVILIYDIFIIIGTLCPSRYLNPVDITEYDAGVCTCLEFHSIDRVLWLIDCKKKKIYNP